MPQELTKEQVLAYLQEQQQCLAALISTLKNKKDSESENQLASFKKQHDLITRQIAQVKKLK
jgi:alanyl-tRNA synthetase